jgi:hypothetical protein
MIFSITNDLNQILDHCRSFNASPEGSFPRYIVKIDDMSLNAGNIRGLRKHLDAIVVGCKCRVYRNLGGGVTVDFDNLD